MESQRDEWTDQRSFLGRRDCPEEQRRKVKDQDRDRLADEAPRYANRLMTQRRNQDCLTKRPGDSTNEGCRWMG